MPATSLVKFMGEKSSNGQPLGWGRVDVDGAPTRGAIPTLPEEELQSRLTRVGDPKNQMFNTNDPEENKEYLAVMDKIVNGWAQCLHREMHFDAASRNVLVYVEWVEWFMQDGSPMHSQAPYMGRSNV